MTVKLFIFTKHNEDACSDAEAESIAISFLTSKMESIRVSNELVILAAQVQVAEKKAEPFQVVYSTTDGPNPDIYTCQKDGSWDRTLPMSRGVYVTLGTRFARVMLGHDKNPA